MIYYVVLCELWHKYIKGVLSIGQRHFGISTAEQAD
nr:MAG TPA: hypothetical protein [Caudoviricetes sp.]